MSPEIYQWLGRPSDLTPESLKNEQNIQNSCDIHETGMLCESVRYLLHQHLPKLTVKIQDYFSRKLLRISSPKATGKCAAAIFLNN